MGLEGGQTRLGSRRLSSAGSQRIMENAGLGAEMSATGLLTSLSSLVSS
jgi:hypothetical protein